LSLFFLFVIPKGNLLLPLSLLLLLLYFAKLCNLRELCVKAFDFAVALASEIGLGFSPGIRNQNKPGF
jgi:hypothetical protein